MKRAAEEKTRLMIATEEAKATAKLEEMKMPAEIKLLEKKLSASLA